MGNSRIANINYTQKAKRLWLNLKVNIKRILCLQLRQISLVYVDLSSLFAVFQSRM